MYIKFTNIRTCASAHTHSKAGLFVPIIEITSGNESFSDPNVSASVYAFYQRSPRAQSSPIWDALKDKRSGVAKLTSYAVNASSVNRNNGMWVTNSLEVPEASLIQMYVQYLGIGSGFDKVIKYRFMVRPRLNAGFRRLAIPLTRHRKAVTNFSYLEGRFDVIHPDRFEEFGIEVVKYQAGDFSKHLFDRFVLSEIIEGEVSALIAPAKPEVKTTVTGKKTLIKRGTGRVVSV